MLLDDIINFFDEYHLIGWGIGCLLADEFGTALLGLQSLINDTLL